MKLEWTPDSRADLRELRVFVNEHSDGAGDVVVKAIVRRAEQIVEFPRAGRVIPEFPLSGIREVLMGSYRILHAVGDSRVVIVAVVHGARNTRG